MDVAAIISLIENSLTATSLLLLVIAGVRGWYIWGSSHTEIVDAYKAQIEGLKVERDQWKNAAQRGTEIADTLSHLVATRRRRDRGDPE